jgi:ArsR family transcriptional regulator
MSLYEDQAELFRTLGDAYRLRILALLRVREACVCELVALLPISQPAVSQHLRRLRQAGLVRERRHKYWTYYALRDDLPAEVRAFVAALPIAPEDAAWLRTHHVDATCAVLKVEGGEPSPVESAEVRMGTRPSARGEG